MDMKANLLKELIDIGIFKTGEFHLKTGGLSPFYVDVRHVASFPKVFRALTEALYDKINAVELKVDVICGVPYAAMPLSSAIAFQHEIPLLIKRKERKSYGTSKMIEGVIKRGDSCVIIEDIVVSGSSIAETVQVLRKEGLVVTDCVTVLDRLQGGESNLQKIGVTLRSLFTIKDLMKVYCTLYKIEDSTVEKIEQYLCENVCSIPQQISNGVSSTPPHPLSHNLWGIIKAKKSNICLSADVTHSSEIFDIAEQFGSHICVLKICLSSLEDFNVNFSSRLHDLAKKQNFLIMVDTNFADCAPAVERQYKHGLYRIAEWADIVTAHALCGSSTIKALMTSSKESNQACVLISQTSSDDGFIDEKYTEMSINLANEYPNYVIGFITPNKIDKNSFLHFCPFNKDLPLIDCVNNSSFFQCIRENNADVLIVSVSSVMNLDSFLHLKENVYNIFSELQSI